MATLESHERIKTTRWVKDLSVVPDMDSTSVSKICKCYLICYDQQKRRPISLHEHFNTIIFTLD